LSLVDSITPVKLVHFGILRCAIRHWENFALTKKTVLAENIVIVEVHSSPLNFPRGPHFHDRRRRRLLTAIGRGPIPGGMGGRAISIGSVLMLTKDLESFLVVFTESVTGGVVRLGIASLQAACCSWQIARINVPPSNEISPFQCLRHTDIVMG
jgi:hypothetical protein